MHRVFVYGSLKRDFEHHSVIRGARLVLERATVAGRLYVAGRYPAVVLGGTGRVYGEVYVVTTEQLERLDEFEDVPHLYQRSVATADDGSEVIVYTMTAEAVRGCPLVASGEWREPERRGRR